jgi:hypothetical protein
MQTPVFNWKLHSSTGSYMLEVAAAAAAAAVAALVTAGGVEVVMASASISTL